MKLNKNDKVIVGIDEAGRGPLAGPVIAGAVVLPDVYELPKLNDSKKLSEKQRDELYDAIINCALAYGIGCAEVAEIDSINILQASLLAMERAYNALNIKVNLALVDGNKKPQLDCETEAVIKGDSKIPAISAASILAKVSRDREMLAMDELYPGYGFAKHKGYPTKLHIQCLQALGPCEIHRKTFRPVSKVLEMHVTDA